MLRILTLARLANSIVCHIVVLTTDVIAVERKHKCWCTAAWKLVSHSETYTIQKTFPNWSDEDDVDKHSTNMCLPHDGRTFASRMSDHQDILHLPITKQDKTLPVLCFAFLQFTIVINLQLIKAQSTY